MHLWQLRIPARTFEGVAMAVELPDPGWAEVADTIAANARSARESGSAVTVQVTGSERFVQWLGWPDGTVSVEADSGWRPGWRHRDIPLTPEQSERLRALGWTPPEDRGKGHEAMWRIDWPPERDLEGLVALLVRTLHEVYSATADTVEVRQVD
jgi:hypothetical protein